MNNCVPGAFFGRSPNGWISTELFFAWSANNFAKITVRPVVLLVDGHSSHIDTQNSAAYLFVFFPMPFTSFNLLILAFLNLLKLHGRNRVKIFVYLILSLSMSLQKFFGKPGLLV